MSEDNVHAALLEMIDGRDRTIAALTAENERLREAAQQVVAEFKEYATINNLFNARGEIAVWQSVQKLDALSTQDEKRA